MRVQCRWTFHAMIYALRDCQKHGEGLLVSRTHLTASPGNIRLEDATNAVPCKRCYGAQTYLPVVSLVGIWLISAGLAQLLPFHFTAALSKIVGSIAEMCADVAAS